MASQKIPWFYHDFGYQHASIWRYAGIPDFQIFDEQLFTTYFDVHQMRRVLAHQFGWVMLQCTYWRCS
jgi:hypothetical protein